MAKFEFLVFIALHLIQVYAFVEDLYIDEFSECGVKNNRIESRIVHGKTTKMHEFPWMAAILTTVIDGVLVGQSCGGALIHPQWVLTAGHCLINQTEEEMYVLLGEYDFKVEDVHTRLLRVSELHRHPNFTTKPTVTNDIAMLKLSEPVTLSQSIRPICLPDPDLSMQNLFGASGLALGWGRLSTNGRSSHKLKEAAMTIHPTEVCQNLYPNVFMSGFLCVGGDGQDVCYGDSGGPLMVKNDDKFQIVGVVSYGIDGCARLGNPSAFTFVPQFLDFINDKIANYSD